jgi:CHAD domain-containing protein
LKARRVHALDPEGTLRDTMGLIVATRLQELTELAVVAVEPGAESAQHDMRIAAKRLRYAIEVAGGCLGAEAEELRARARELQDVLGEMHDCDVMLPRVAGIESVGALLHARRELLFARFRELWEKYQPLPVP